ncbi:hypothetical protein NBRC116495_08070 [Aurantivibrio plasticivorans]
MQRFHQQFDREIFEQRSYHASLLNQVIHRSGESAHKTISDVVLQRSQPRTAASPTELFNSLENNLERQFPELNRHWLIDQAVLVDSENNLVSKRYSTRNKDAHIEQWLAGLSEKEKFGTLGMSCSQSNCFQIFNFPVFYSNSQIGNVLMKRPLQALLNQVITEPPVHIGVIQPSVVQSDKYELEKASTRSTVEQWNADIFGTAFVDKDLAAIRKAGEFFPIETLMGKAFVIDMDRTFYSISVMPVRGFNPNQARYLLITDVTAKRQEMLATIYQEILVMTAIASVFLVYLLALSWRQFERIKHQLKIFPLIGEKQFKEARDIVLQHRNKTLYRDEIDSLDDVVTSLTYQLESLEKAVSLRNREMERLSLFDSLTGLANRNLFQYELQSDVMTFEANGGMVAAVILDLDKFKRINDTIGHQQGDMLLGKVGARLKNATKSLGLVARLGGDEFGIILRSAKATSHIELLSHKILELIHKPIDLDGHNVVISGSLGVALATQGQDADELIKNAEIAMYTAKNSGGNAYRIFDPAMATEAHANLSLETDIRRAFKDKEFTLFLQPKVNMDAAIEGFEALIRWDHPDRGMVPPIEFIPVMENLGLISELDNFVLDASCRQLHLLQRHYPNISIAVNISSTHFTDKNFIVFLKQCLEKYPIDPSLLELEITETLLMENMSTGMEVIQEIKEIGVSIAIDDFGTGYSSLSYLKKLPVDTIKIDREFIKDIPDSESDMQISSVIIFLAKQLDFKVVAEGVETKEQLVFLKANHCDLAQGFLFSKPVPAHKAILLLETQRGNLKQQNVS